MFGLSATGWLLPIIDILYKVFRVSAICDNKTACMASFVVNICYAISCWTIDINGVKRCEWGNAYLMFVDSSPCDMPTLLVNNV